MKFSKPKCGDCRTISRFLLLPKTLRSPITYRDETRWLEFARWEQKLVTSKDIMDYVVNPSNPYVWEDQPFWSK